MDDVVLKTSAKVLRRGEETRTRMIAAIRDFIAEHGYSPTVRELGDAVGLKTTSSVFAQLRTLAQQKRITFKPEMPRTIQLTGGPDRCPCCGRALP
jgi:repressor LexA